MTCRDGPAILFFDEILIRMNRTSVSARISKAYMRAAVYPSNAVRARLPPQDYSDALSHRLRNAPIEPDFVRASMIASPKATAELPSP